MVECFVFLRPLGLRLSLLNLKHNGHTEIRFSINTSSIINQYEHVTASRDKRIEASMNVAQAGYPTGF